MSNVINLVPTAFTNLRSGNQTFGYRIYDDHHCLYDNLWDKVPEDDMEFLADVVADVRDNAAPEGVKEMFEFCIQHEQGLEIDGQSYSFDDIKDIIKDFEKLARDLGEDYDIHTTQLARS